MLRTSVSTLCTCAQAPSACVRRVHENHSYPDPNRSRHLPYRKPKLTTTQFSLHQIEALVKAGVKDIVLAVNYRPEVMVAMLKKTEEEYGITINFSVETEPLGTGE